ncbi:MAG TPA: HAD hydrolase-like protein [Sphingobacterium sp.]|nr:HAD hydrolase-like protein [Sphingobacterium sp.]
MKIKQYNYLLFDLDGTLADPSEGITKCIAYALEHFGIETPDLHILESWIGPPIKQSLMEIHHFDEAQADLGLEKYRERFTETGIYENRLFDDVPELLSQLKQKGYHISLATSKPTVFAERILEHFGIRQYFDFVGGAGLDDSRPTKGHVIQHVIEQTALNNPSEALMIGDRKYDIIGGKSFQIDTAGLLHGFGSREELTEAGATYIFDDLEMLADFLIV